MVSFNTLVLTGFAAASVATVNAHSNLPMHRHRMQKKSIFARKSGEATVKCLTSYTWALCAGSACTDMGSVADGTMCKNDAITWDDKSSVASSDVAAPVSTFKVTKSAGSTIAVVSDVGTATGTVKVVLAAKPTSGADASTIDWDSTTAAPTASASASGDDDECDADDSDDDDDECDADDDDDDDDECDADDNNSGEYDATSASADSTASFSSAWSSKWSSSSSSKTSSKASSTTSSAAAASSSASSSGSEITGGYATFYYQEGTAGACGKYYSDSDKVVALQVDRYGNTGEESSDCFRTVKITNNDNGKSTTAIVADACPGCSNENSLDLSIAAFDAIADEDTGVVPITWEFTS